MKKFYLYCIVFIWLNLCGIVILFPNSSENYILHPISSTNLLLSENKQSRGIASQEVARIHNLTGENINIAFLDSGINLTHEVFARFGGQIPYYEVVINRSTIAPDTTLIRDFHGHGSHVASIALGNSTSFRGVAPAANCIIVNCFESASSTIANRTVVQRAMEWIYNYSQESPLDILSISIGAPSSPLIQDNMTQWIRTLTEQGITVVASVGNNGQEGEGTVLEPAISPYAISVGAMDLVQWIPCEWNGHGHINGAYIKPDLLAPGVDELGADSNSSNAYIVMTGTSQATPYVSGVAALLMQYCREHDLNITPVLLKWLLEMGAWRFYSTPSIIPDTIFGAGLVQLAPIINFLERNQSESILTLDHSTGVSMGSIDSMVNLIPCYLSAETNLRFKISSADFALGLYDRIPNQFGQPILLYSGIKTSSLAVRVNNSGIYYLALKGTQNVSPQQVTIQIIRSRLLLVYITVDVVIMLVFMIGLVSILLYDRFLLENK